MFRSLRLSESFEFLLSPLDWSWFGPMVQRGVLHYDVEGWPAFCLHEIRAYPDVWNKAAGIALEKLQAGDWVATGLSANFGPGPIPIDTQLWDYLRIKDRLEEAEGAGYRFVGLRVSDLAAPVVTGSHAEKAVVRKQLTEWIRSHSSHSSFPPLRKEQFPAAVKAFPGANITQNLYDECRRAAGLSRNQIQRGRPKA